MSSVVAKGETRGLAAALAGPAFLPRATTTSLAGAERHMSRWAPESSSILPRSLRSVAFTDRLVAPLFAAASQIGGLRMFSNYESDGFRERQVASSGWLFPKPWYQDELRWLAAARMEPTTDNAMFTTRGTFASRDGGQGRFERSVPPELFPYVAPALANSRESLGISAIDAWSPSLSVPSMSAARMHASLGANLSSTLGPMSAGGSFEAANGMGRSPQINALAASIRTALALPQTHAMSLGQSRLANLAPEMVTPPAPRRATPSINDYGSSANLDYREQLAAQRSVVQQRLLQLASDSATSTSSTANVPVQAAVAWDQVSQTQPAIGERQGQAKSLARQHVELLAQNQLSSPAIDANETRGNDASHVQLQNDTLNLRGATGNISSSGLISQASALQTLDVSKLARLVEQLRFAEIVAADTSHGAFAQVQGPSMLMPAGLGGLAAAVVSSRSASNISSLTQFARPSGSMPGIELLRSNQGAAGQRASSVSALTSIGESAPRALAHVAWSDRWLGRFAGAAPQQLASFDTTSATVPTLSTRNAPPSVFVAPRASGARELGFTLNDGMRQDASGNNVLPPGSAAPGSSVSLGSAATRYDDDSETPDEIFAAIASSAASSRARQRGERTASAASMSLVQPAVAPALALTATTDDASTKLGHRSLALQAPQVAGAGFAAGLSASPFAGGLRDAGMVSGESIVPAFDVRAMFTAALVEAFFRGEYADLAATVPTSTVASSGNSMVARSMHDFAPTWLHATTAGGGQSTKQVGRNLDDVAEPTTYPAPSITNERRGGIAQASSSLPTGQVFDAALPTYAANDEAGVSSLVQTGFDSSRFAQAGGYEVFELSVPAAFGGFDGRVASDSAVAANQRIDYRPGAVGRLASAWSVSQQNASTDLLLDFLPPELVVAAQRYGLTPQAALVAARLSAAGPAAIASLASQVDWAFLHVPSTRTSLLGNGRGRQPMAAESAGAVWSDAGSGNETSMARSFGGFDRDMAFASRSVDVGDSGNDNFVLADATATINSLAPTRQPRGAFLWPHATATALGIKPESLGALDADSQSRFSVAALEVLAAKAVADLGAYAMPSAARQARGVTTSSDGQGVPFVDVSRRPDLLRSVLQAGSTMGSGAELSYQSDSDTDLADTHTAPNIVERVAAQLPAPQQQQFRALFLRGIGSPSVRAAQALALVQRSGVLAGSASLAERASLAWDAMPMLEVQKQLESGQGGFDLGVLDALAASVANATSTVVIPNAPRLASALAALQSMVAPTNNGNVSNTSSVAPSASVRAGDSLASLITSNTASAGAMRRAPTAAAEMVRTGARRTGESEIPDWFEKAARKMFGEPSGTAADGLSMADLTLINAAPPQQVAASTRGESVAPSATPSVSSAGAEAGGGNKIDVERTARDVYRAVLQIMEAARARNGEPYL